MTSSTTRSLIWLIILALINGCVPSRAAPAPTLDPNAIEIFIAQTANPAATQTAMAMPTFTPAATFTLIPQKSDTPEPTPTEEVIYFRVKHDSQLAIYNNQSRTADRQWEGGSQTPEVVPLFTLPKLSSGTLRTKLDGDWEAFIDALNDNDATKLRYLKAHNSALFNTAGFPQLESLTMGGNIITLDDIQGEWGKVDTLGNGLPPDIKDANYVARPDLIHKFVVVGWRKSNGTTVLLNPPKGDLYWPLVTKGPVWIQMKRLEKFPDLPMVVTAKTGVFIQTTPGPDNMPTQRRLSAGQSATVVEYYPSASNVWGRLESGGWIALLWYTISDGPQYFTSWTMGTLPPPPPTE